MFYNLPCWLKNQRVTVQESSGKSSYGGIAQLGARTTHLRTPKWVPNLDPLLQLNNGSPKIPYLEISGGIAQLGAHVTSETTPNLFEKCERLAVDNSSKMFYNRHRWAETRRCLGRKSSGKSSYGGIAQLGAQVTSKTTPNLSKKLAKFSLDIFRNSFYNQRGLMENQRFHLGKVTGEFHMGV